jgi:hypothetical protein
MRDLVVHWGRLAHEACSADDLVVARVTPRLDLAISVGISQTVLAIR